MMVHNLSVFLYAVTITSAMILKNIRANDPINFEKSFQALTSSSLSWLDKEFDKEVEKSRLAMSHGSKLSSGGNEEIENKINEGSVHSKEELPPEQQRNVAIAKALIRRIVYKCLHKYSTISSKSDIEKALKYHVLPKEMQANLHSKYGPDEGNLPNSWYDAIQQLQNYCKLICDDTDDYVAYKRALWEHILTHPITAYIPVQCQSCGYIVPDEYNSNVNDADIGLSEVEPSPEEKPHVRTGWFRGPRLEPKVFQLDCPNCGHVSRWYRSRSPYIILNPNKWGRLCGEQQDLILDLANYLDINIRTILPLDWDHIWSEYQVDDDDGLSSYSNTWNLQNNADERNFVVRLDEGIGYFTRIFAICTNPISSGDVSDLYFNFRLDEKFGRNINRYQQMMEEARNDESGLKTQSHTVNGYAIDRSKLTTAEITKEIQNSVEDYCYNKKSNENTHISWYDI